MLVLRIVRAGTLLGVIIGMLAISLIVQKPRVAAEAITPPSPTTQPIPTPDLPTDAIAVPAVDPEQLPICPQALVEGPNTSSSPRAYVGAQTECRVPGHRIEIPVIDPDQVVIDPAQIVAGLPRPYMPPLDPSLPTDGSGSGGSQPGTSPAGIGGANYSYSINYFSCQNSNSCSSGSPGITESYLQLSSQIPTLPPSETFSNYHLYNRVHFNYPSSIVRCNAMDVPEYISAGVGYGNFGDGGNIYRNVIIVAAATHASCRLNITGVTVSPPLATTIHIYRDSGAWVVRVFKNGVFMEVDRIPTRWNVATEMEAGQEIFARNAGEKQFLVSPVNYVHKHLVAGTNNSLRPFSDVYSFAEPLFGETRVIVEEPFSAIDLLGGDFTSMTTTVNYQRVR